jgi:hypothetical protein
MKQFLVMLAFLMSILLPVTISARPVPRPLPPPPNHHVREVCYKVYTPYPHVYCERVHVRNDAPRHYRPLPPPPPPKHYHHHRAPHH